MRVVVADVDGISHLALLSVCRFPDICPHTHYFALDPPGWTAAYTEVAAMFLAGRTRVTPQPQPPQPQPQPPQPQPQPPQPQPQPPQPPAGHHVTALGPRSGPAGFGLMVGVSDCPPAMLRVLYDQVVLLDYPVGPPDSPFPNTALVPSVAGPGTHTLQFACITTRFGTGNILWTDSGFTVTVTAPSRPATLQSNSVKPGDTFTYLSGASAGQSPCPPVGGLPVTGAEVWLGFPYDPPGPPLASFPWPDGGAISYQLQVPSSTPPGQYSAEERCLYGTSASNYAIFDYAPEVVGVLN